MKKIIPIKHDKIWGYELWLHSPLAKSRSLIEGGGEIVDGPLIKIIKADQPLSVQVHPDDQLAKELENEPNGKSECWYVIDANENSQFVVGIKTTNVDEIQKSIDNNTFMDLLKTITPQKGEFINVPAGMVHGIAAESKVLEVQQPSDTTYRFFDYNRLENNKPRELHIEKSLKAIKDIDWKVNSKNTDGHKYTIENYDIEIFEEIKTLENDCIVVDLKEEVAYVASKGENITFDHWVAIQY